MIRSAPVPLRGDWKEEGEHWGRDPSRGVNSEPQVGCCRPGVLAGGDEPPLAGWQAGRNSRKAVGRRDRACVCVCVCVCVCARARARARMLACVPPQGEQGRGGSWTSALVAARFPAWAYTSAPHPPPGTASRGNPGLGQSLLGGSSHGWHLLKWRIRRSLAL